MLLCYLLLCYFFPIFFGTEEDIECRMKLADNKEI